MITEYVTSNVMKWREAGLSCLNPDGLILRSGRRIRNLTIKQRVTIAYILIYTISVYRYYMHFIMYLLVNRYLVEVQGQREPQQH
jgi:hypothetical protein